MTLTPGTEVSITNQRGRFRFVNAQTTSQGKLVLNFIGGSSGHERVKRVHRIARTRANAS
jgi:hypothetical protein